MTQGTQQPHDDDSTEAQAAEAEPFSAFSRAIPERVQHDYASPAAQRARTRMQAEIRRDRA